MTTSASARRWRRLLTVFTLSGVALVAGAGIAAAHVSVNPSDAPAGDFTTLTFHVPNESPTAGTTAVTVALPTDHPFASVAVKAISGWKVTPTTTTLPAPVTEGGTTITKAVTSVTWTADAGVSLKPGEFGEFELSAGPVPAVESLAFPTTQTYSDGKVVQWNEPTPASGEEPENPVPTLTVTPAVTGAGDAHGQGAEASASAAGTPATATVSDATVSAAASTSAAAPSDGTSSATILAVVSLVVAAASLVVAAVALRRRPTGGAGR